MKSSFPRCCCVGAEYAPLLLPCPSAAGAVQMPTEMPIKLAVRSWTAEDIWMWCPHVLQAAAWVSQLREKAQPSLSLLTFLWVTFYVFPYCSSPDLAAWEPQGREGSQLQQVSPSPRVLCSLPDPTALHRFPQQSRLNPPICKSAFQKAVCIAQQGLRIPHKVQAST